MTEILRGSCKVEAFIQARMGSTRLPGKVLKNVMGRPLLDFLIERLRQSQEIDDIVILTSRQPADDAIVQFCMEKKVPFFRGSEEDVLERYYQAAARRSPDGIVRITSDCPLIDPEIVDEVIKTFREGYPGIDYASNTLERSFPRGLDVEVISSRALEEAHLNAKKSEEREHVTLYIYRHPERFRLKSIKLFPSCTHHRWTVDTPEDYALIKLILESLYPENPRFRLKDILELISKHPDWSLLNAHIEQKKISN